MLKKSCFSPVLIWFVLMAATVASWWMSMNSSGDAKDFLTPEYAVLCILLVAWVKVRFVVLDFMEVRHAPLPLRLALEAWMAFVVIVLAFYFLLA